MLWFALQRLEIILFTQDHPGDWNLPLLPSFPQSHNRQFPKNKKLLVHVHMWRANSLERPWCWERLRVGGEGGDRGWDGGQHDRLNGYELEQTLGDSEGQGSLVCCRPTKSQTRPRVWTTITLKISGVRSHDVCIISHLSLLLKNYSQALSPTLGAKTTLKESRKREERIISQNVECFSQDLLGVFSWMNTCSFSRHLGLDYEITWTLQ